MGQAMGWVRDSSVIRTVPEAQEVPAMGECPWLVIQEECTGQEADSSRVLEPRYSLEGGNNGLWDTEYPQQLREV